MVYVLSEGEGHSVVLSHADVDHDGHILKLVECVLGIVPLMVCGI